MEGLDFRSMSRRDLQALCKKHCIPANSTNAHMADRLAALFSKKGNEGPRPVGPSCLKGSGGSGGLQGDGYCTRSKRKMVTFLLPEKDPNLGEAGERNDPGGEDLPEPAAAALAPRLTRSRALRLQENTETAILTSSGARTLKHPKVDGNSATAVIQVHHDCKVDEGLVALRHGLRGVVTHADGATRRSRRLRDPGLTEEIGTVAAAATPAAVPVPEVPENIVVGRRRGSRKHHQDPMLVLSTSPQGRAPATGNVARAESETGGPRRSKRNHRNPEFAMAGGGASEISAAGIPGVGVEAEKEGSFQILETQRRSQRKPAIFQIEEMGGGFHKDAAEDKLQRKTRKSAPEPADKGISAITCESKNCHKASSKAKKSEVPQGGEHLRRSKRNVHKKLVHDMLPTEGENSEDDHGRVAGAVLPTKQNIQTTRRRTAFARENGKITGSLEVQENSTNVSDYDEPSKRKRRRSVKCGDAEQKVSLPQSEKPGYEKDLEDKKCCSWETETQRSDKDSPKTFPFSDSILDGNVVMGDVQDSAEPSQLGEIAKEAKYQGSEDISKQEEMAGGVAQDVNGALAPTESLLATDVPLENPKTGTAEPDRRGIQREEHDKPEEDIEKFELESLKEDSQVYCMASPVVAKKSHGLCDQEQKEDLPGFSPSSMKDTVEHSHANEKPDCAQCPESCDGEVQSSSCIDQCHVGANEKPDCAQLSEHVIDDSDGKTCTDMMEMQSSPTHGLSSVSEPYNPGCNLTLEITAVGVDEPLSNSCKEAMIEDVTKSPLIDDQGSVSHDYLSNLLMGNKNKEVPLEARETNLSSAETLITGGKFSPCSDGMQAFCTHNVSYNLDDPGSELNGNSPPGSLMRSGDATVPDEAVAATSPGMRLLEKECESSSSDGSHPNDHEVNSAEAHDPIGSHAFSNASEVAQKLAWDVDTKENIGVDVTGNFSSQSFSLFGAPEKTTTLLDNTEGRQGNKEPYAPRRNSPCDTALLDIASITSNFMVSRHLVDLSIEDFHTGIELLDSQNEAGLLAEGTSSGPKSLEKSLPTQTEDLCVLKESGEKLTSEDGAIKFSDTTQISAEKKLKLDEREESMEARAFMHDTVFRVIETSTRTKSKEVEVAVDSKRSQETSLNAQPKEGSFDNNLGEEVEATPDAHECVISISKFANKVAVIEDMEGELAYAVSFSGYQGVASSAVRDLHRQTNQQNKIVLVTQEAEDGFNQESLVRDLVSAGKFTVQMPSHPTVCDEGVELADIQEIGSSAEVSSAVVAAQLDEELSSSQGISSELLTVSSNVDVTYLSNYKPLCETYTLANNRCLAGDTVVESEHPFPDNASDKIVEDRTEAADLLVNTSSVKEDRPVLNETGKPLLDMIAFNEEYSEDKKNSPTNIEQFGYMDSYRTTERKPCGLGLNTHRETVELIKDTVARAGMLGTEISGWKEKTVAKGENAYQSTLELEKEIETMGDQHGHIHALSAVKTPEVQGTGLDGKCSAGADESSFQIGKLLLDETITPAIWPTNGGKMNRSAKCPESPFVETDCDVCEITTTKTCLSSNDRDKDRLIELSQLSDVNTASAEIQMFSPIIQVISPDRRTDNCVLQAKEKTIEHNSSDESSFEVLCKEKSICHQGFVDPSGNEKKDEKPYGDLSEHNPSYESYPEVLQTQKSAGNHDFTASSENEQEQNNPSTDILEHNLSYETSPEYLHTENAVGGHDDIDNGEIEKEVEKLDGDVSENNSDHETCLGAPQTENSVGDQGFINLSENEKEDDKPNRDVPEHKSNYVTCSEGIQTETVGCHNFVDHGENEQENDQPNRYVSKQELSSEEESVKEKGDNRNDKLKVVTPGELVSVEQEVNQLIGEKPEQISSSFYQSEVYGTANLMSANDFRDHKELENEDNISNVGLPEQEQEHKAEYRQLLQQNKDTMGQEGLLISFEPKILADEGRFDENLKHDIRNYTAGTTMRFAELEHIKHEDASSNRCSSTSDDNYFPHVEAPAVEIPLEDIQITLTQRPDIGVNLEHVPWSWDWKNTIKDMNHEVVAGTVQDQEAVEMWTEEPETQQQKEDLQYVNDFDSPYRQDTKDGLTYTEEHEAVESYSVKAHNLGSILEVTQDSKSSNRLEDVSRESNDHCASVMCTTNEHEQSKSKLTGNYTRRDQGEVCEFFRNTQSSDGMHLSGMEIDGNDEEEKLQLASFEELVLDTDAAVGNNGDDREQTLASRNSKSANFLGDSDSTCDRQLDIGKAEDRALVNHFSYASLSDGRKGTPPNLDFAYEVFPESAIQSEVEHFALVGTCADDKHGSAKETTMVVANDMNTPTLHHVEEENCYPRKDAATTTSDCPGCHVEDAVGSLDEVEEINDIFGDMQISTARNHMTTGRISCTPQRNQSSKIFHIENGQENTPFSKMSHSANIFVEKSTVDTSKRKALANLQNRIHRD